MANLYEINEKLLTALARAEEEAVENDGEIRETTGEELDSLEMEREEKIENTALFIKNMNAEIAMIKAEEKALKERRQAVENKAERVKEWLSFNLHGETRKSGKFSLSYRKSQAVKIDNESEIPTEYTTVKTQIMPLKADIKKAILKGEIVSGASIEERKNLVIK